MDNCWISCQVMADMKKVYDDLININLYSLQITYYCCHNFVAFCLAEIHFHRLVIISILSISSLIFSIRISPSSLYFYVYEPRLIVFVLKISKKKSRYISKYVALIYRKVTVRPKLIHNFRNIFWPYVFSYYHFRQIFVLLFFLKTQIDLDSLLCHAVTQNRSSHFVHSPKKET